MRQRLRLGDQLRWSRQHDKEDGCGRRNAATCSSKVASRFSRFFSGVLIMIAVQQVYSLTMSPAALQIRPIRPTRLKETIPGRVPALQSGTPGPQGFNPLTTYIVGDLPCFPTPIPAPPRHGPWRKGVEAPALGPFGMCNVGPSRGRVLGAIGAHTAALLSEPARVRMCTTKPAELPSAPTAPEKR